MPTLGSRFGLCASFVCLGSVLLGACDGKGTEVTPGAPAASTGPQDAPASAELMRRKTEILPPAEVIAETNNPSRVPIYTGPTGTVRGIVKVSGDEAPVMHGELDGARPDCQLARPTFGRLFREGAGRSLADVLVAVTGYEAYVPAKKDTVVIQGRGCSWDRRTVAMTFGQKLDVVAGDNRPYVPDLVGQNNVAQMFVMPGAEPVRLVPRKPGRFLLLDSMRLYNRAEVFVLTYPTATVTGLDGHFEIQGIPVGKVRVSAMLPQTEAIVEREIEVVAGQPVELELELAFDAAAFAEKKGK